MQYAFVHALYQHVRPSASGTATSCACISAWDGAGNGVWRAASARSPPNWRSTLCAAAIHPARVHYLRQAAENALHRYANPEAIDLSLQDWSCSRPCRNACSAPSMNWSCSITLGPALIAIRAMPPRKSSRLYPRPRPVPAGGGHPAAVRDIVWSVELCLCAGGASDGTGLGAHLLTQAQRQPDAVLQLAGYFACGVSLAMSGYVSRGTGAFGAGRRLSTPEQHHVVLYPFWRRSGVFCRAWLSHVLWLLGYAEQALAHEPGGPGPGPGFRTSL